MELTPDAIVYGRWGPFAVNATVAYTWLVLLVLTAGSWLVTRRLVADGEGRSRWQGALEAIVDGTRQQIAEITHQTPTLYLPFLGTLFLFILTSNVLAVVPGFHPPTGSLSTTTALALAVFVAAPAWGIKRRGLRRYLRNYIEPTPLMLPFNVVGEISRTLALAVRLFGNMMSGTTIAAIFLAIAPLLFPVVMQLLGLVTGVIQAYIFAVLAAVYIAAATQAHQVEDGLEGAVRDSQKEEGQHG